jgi:hypothetical protein
VTATWRSITDAFAWNRKTSLTLSAIAFCLIIVGVAGFVWWRRPPRPIPPSEIEPIESFEDAAAQAEAIKEEIDRVLRKAREIRDDLTRAAVGPPPGTLGDRPDDEWADLGERLIAGREDGFLKQAGSGLAEASLAELDGTLTTIGLQLTHLIKRVRQMEGGVIEKHQWGAKERDDEIQRLRAAAADREDRINTISMDRHRFEGLAAEANQRADRARRDKEELRRGLAELELSIERRDSDLRAKDRALQAVTAERDRLREEHEAILEEGLKAERKHAEAKNLLAQYEQGMPKFLDGTENGTHYERFFDLITEANSEVPDHVPRLALMLRVFAGASAREDSEFELVWCVHEIGKALYAVMQALGKNHEWQYEEAIAWALALNRHSNARYRIFVPVVNASFNIVEMTGGPPNGAVQMVKSWGVRNARGDVERRAIVK